MFRAARQGGLAAPLHAEPPPHSTSPMSVALLLANGLLLCAGCGYEASSQDKAALPPLVQAAKPHQAIHVRVMGERLTIRAADATLGAVLGEISRQTGLMVRSTPDVDQRVTVAIDALPLRDALAQLLHQHNYLLRYNSPGAQQSTLWIFSPGTAQVTSAPKSLSSGLSAVAAAADAGGDNAIANLTAMALQDPDHRVRAEAVQALAETNADSLIAPLQQALLDPAYQVRAAAIEALAELGGDAAALALTHVLSTDSVRGRLDAVDALGDMGGPTAIQVLQQAAADPDSSVRESATQYLAELR